MGYVLDEGSSKKRQLQTQNQICVSEGRSSVKIDDSQGVVLNSSYTKHSKSNGMPSAGGRTKRDYKKFSIKGRTQSQLAARKDREAKCRNHKSINRRQDTRPEIWINGLQRNQIIGKKKEEAKPIIYQLAKKVKPIGYR
ncbi:hypothetical protein HAX54_028908 [Datura stramonium]|uniref:Uncharacterized protein n=1 Tax=Datura stramonium TaxID=4076 RepID=A0ABS8V746_DATST|nr:hypothetical protein [Datura stramonium]